MATLRRTTEAQDDVVAIQRVRTMHLGPDEVLITMRVQSDEAATVDLVGAIGRLRNRLRDPDDRLSDVTIEPAAPE